LKVKQENKLFKEYNFFIFQPLGMFCLNMSTLKKHSSKYGDFVVFFPKNNFYPSWIFFFMMQIFVTKRNQCHAFHITHIPFNWNICANTKCGVVDVLYC